MSGCRHRALLREPRPGGHLIGFRDVATFSKGEVLEAVGRLAVAHRVLLENGELAAAQELGRVLVLLEHRVVL